MAKRYNNDKGFLIIQINPFEAIKKINFGCKCDNCNNDIDLLDEDGFGDVYYVAALNRALCKRCCDDFIKGYERNNEDIPYEKRHYNYYAKKLNLEEV